MAQWTRKKVLERSGKNHNKGVVLERSMVPRKAKMVSHWTSAWWWVWLANALEKRVGMLAGEPCPGSGRESERAEAYADTPCANGALDLSNEETDVDCGGARCTRCAAGGSCAVDADARRFQISTSLVDGSGEQTVHCAGDAEAVDAASSAVEPLPIVAACGLAWTGKLVLYASDNTSAEIWLRKRTVHRRGRYVWQRGWIQR